MSSGQIPTASFAFSLLRRGGLVVLAALSASTSGCGQSTYAERVGRTAELYAYHNRLDQALQQEWSRGDWQLGMRPPVRFQLMPAPVPPKPNEEGEVEVVPDTRQPDYLGVEFPGLVAAWKVPGEAFIYLCSNHQRFVDAQAATGSAADPETFFADLEAILQQALEFTLSADPARGPAELHAKFSERIPLSDQFAPQKTFQSIRIQKPTDPKFVANVYEHQVGQIQVALILIYAPDNPGNFENNVRIALETLRVEPVVPRAATTPAVGGGATGATPPPAF